MNLLDFSLPVNDSLVIIARARRGIELSFSLNNFADFFATEETGYSVLVWHPGTLASENQDSKKARLERWPTFQKLESPRVLDSRKVPKSRSPQAKPQIPTPQSPQIMESGERSIITMITPFRGSFFSFFSFFSSFDHPYSMDCEPKAPKPKMEKGRLK